MVCGFYVGLRWDRNGCQKTAYVSRVAIVFIHMVRNLDTRGALLGAFPWVPFHWSLVVWQ